MTPDRVTAYAQAVVAAEIPAGRLQILACQRHLRDLARQETPAFPFHYDEQEAADRIGFFLLLHHFKGEWAGQPLALAGWQAFIIGSLFAWKREDGMRRFRVAYNELPRGSGKSTISSGIAINLAFFDGEPGAEVYCAGTKRDQAKIVFDACKRMVQSSPKVRDRGLGVHINNLHQDSSASKLEPLGADADTMDGLRVHGAVIDELHAHKTRSVVDVLDSATGTRRQPLIFEITTAGFDRTSVCWEHHDYSVKVLEGIFEDETWFGFICGIDDKDDPWDPASWAKANPNLGVSVKLDDLQRKAAKAQRLPAAQNEFLRKHLNVWTEQSSRALDMADWDACVGPATWQELRASLDGRDAFLGLDLANTTDLAAGVLVLPADDGCFDLVPTFWMPSERIHDRPLAERIRGWIRQDLIEETDGNVIDYEQIRVDLNALGDRVALKNTGFDPWNATQLATQLTSDGFQMTEMRQGHRTMGEPTKRFLDLVAAHKIRHGGHPVLRWMASNLVVRLDPNANVCPDKSKAGEKIDGIVAAIIGLGCAIRQPEKKASVYTTRGALVAGRTVAQPVSAPSERPAIAAEAPIVPRNVNPHSDLSSQTRIWGNEIDDFVTLDKCAEDLGLISSALLRMAA